MEFSDTSLCIDQICIKLNYQVNTNKLRVCVYNFKLTRKRTVSLKSLQKIKVNSRNSAGRLTGNIVIGRLALTWQIVYLKSISTYVIRCKTHLWPDRPNSEWIDHSRIGHIGEDTNRHVFFLSQCVVIRTLQS